MEADVADWLQLWRAMTACELLLQIASMGPHRSGEAPAAPCDTRQAGAAALMTRPTRLKLSVRSCTAPAVRVV